MHGIARRGEVGAEPFNIAGSPAFAAMGVCWRTRYRLLYHSLLAENDHELQVAERLAKINEKYTFYFTLTLGSTSVLSTAHLEFDENEYSEAEANSSSPDAEPSNDQLLEVGTQLRADSFAANAAALEFVVHKPYVECYVKRADGKVAVLFRAGSGQTWVDNADEGEDAVFVSEPGEPPTEHDPERDMRAARMFVGECDTRGCLRPQWITRTQKHSFTQKRRLDEREENDQQHAMEGKLEDDSLFMNCTLNLEDGPALTVSMTRAHEPTATTIMRGSPAFRPSLCTRFCGST